MNAQTKTYGITKIIAYILPGNQKYDSKSNFWWTSFNRIYSRLSSHVSPMSGKIWKLGGGDPEPNTNMDPDCIKTMDITRTLYIKATQKNVGRSGRS